MAFVGILIVTLLAASTFTLYRLPGHDSAPPADIFRILKGFLADDIRKPAAISAPGNGVGVPIREQ